MALKGVCSTSFGLDRFLHRLNVAWSYTYTYGTVNKHPDGWVPCVPTGTYDEAVIRTTARKRPGSYWLFLNEPDRYDQGNISPVDAVPVYRDFVSVVRSADLSARFIIGNVSSPEAYEWTRQFVAAYKSATGSLPIFDGVGAHHYWPGYKPMPYTIEGWQQPLITLHNNMVHDGFADKELWVTEFGSLVARSIAKQVLLDQHDFMSSTPWLTRYAFFATRAHMFTTHLLTITGELSSLGKIYADW